LYELLAKKKPGSEVTVKLRRIEGGRGMIFTYIERKLRVTRLELMSEKSAI
jgi:hypothetical protein